MPSSLRNYCLKRYVFAYALSVLAGVRRRWERRKRRRSICLSESVLRALNGSISLNLCPRPLHPDQWPKTRSPCMWQGCRKRGYTHREDHLQVVEHLDLLREALAAPPHQVVLAMGRRVANSH